ncbi:MAG: flagellar hook-length control protein FliK [Vicinamibacteraceae bacterium]
MEVPRVEPIGPVEPAPPVTGDRPAGGGDLPFGPGQKLYAQVLQLMGEGRALLDVGGERLIASTPLPVRAGEVLAVVVRGVGAVVELEIEAPPVAFSERAYALAAVRQALQESSPAAPLTTAEVEVLVHALERANWGGSATGPSPRDRLVALVKPVPLGRDAAPLVDVLRDRLTSGGTFFEAHAARALADHTPATLPHDLQTDLRWLLAALGREAETQPDIEPLRQRVIHEIASRQLDVALANVKDGEVRIDIPVAFGHVDTTARLAVKDDGPPPAPGARPRGRAITLTVSHPELGPIEAAAQWLPGATPEDLQIRFAVRDAAAAEILSPATSELSARLRSAGFRHVGIAVVVDPAAAQTPRVEGPDEPPPGGSILSALA